MTSWSRREGWHLRLDPSLRTYVAQVVQLVGDRPQADVLDVAAGSAWLGQFHFGSYTPLDIAPPHERWDIETPLPDHHVAQYDLVTCLGGLHYSIDPPRSLAEMVRALRPGGELIIAVPWLYPPHDPGHDGWRISPVQLWRLLDEHFERVELHPNGSVFHLPLHVLNRYVTGPFRGVRRADLDRMSEVAVPSAWSAGSAEEVPPTRWRPMVVLGRGSSLRTARAEVS